MACDRCLSLRGYAPAAIEPGPGGVSCSARCTRALLWWEVSPVFHHRLDLVVREPVTAGCGFEPRQHSFECRFYLMKYPQSSPLTEIG